MAAAALDATDPPAARDLGRREARRIITDAHGAIAALFAAVGFTPGEARPPAMSPATATAGKPDDATEPEHDDTRDVAALGAAVEDVLHARNLGEEENAVQNMPLAGVFFLAIVGTVDEQAGVEGPLVLALRAIRATVDAWARSRSGNATHTPVAWCDLDLLVRRIDAVIEIARRGGVGGAS